MNEHLSDVSLSCTITAPSLHHEVNVNRNGHSNGIHEHHHCTVTAPSLHEADLLKRLREVGASDGAVMVQ